jgi:hypothetical protein
MWLLVRMWRIPYTPLTCKAGTRPDVVELQQSVIRTPIKVTFVSLAIGLLTWYVSLHRRQWVQERMGMGKVPV